MTSMQNLHPYANIAQRAELINQSAFVHQYSGSETDVSASTSTENLTHEEKYVLRNSERQEPQGEENLTSATSSPFNSLTTRHKRHKSATDRTLYISEKSTNMQRANLSPTSQLRQTQRKPPIVPYDRTLANIFNKSDSSSEYLDQPGAQHKDWSGQDDLSHVYNPAHLPPAPPTYPKWRNLEGSRRISSMDKGGKMKTVVSRSQPDLTQIGGGKWDESNSLPQRPKTRGRAVYELDNEMTSANGAEMIMILTKENLSLKVELESYYRKISKLPKLEMEIQNVHQSYEDLVKSSEKREYLARIVRVKLEMEIKRLQELSGDLMEQLDIATSTLSKRQPDELGEMELKKEINRRDVLIAQLITHNKELVAAKERHEIELAAQRATLQEQRTHIDILDSALTNAQANVVKIEEECRKKQAYVERVTQLQKALNSLQTASDKREKMEKRLRNQLEKEILDLRSQGGNLKNSKSDELKQQLRENEEKLMMAQTEVTKWEQKYLEESALRQIAIETASMPKDAKIAALERTSQENERVIAHARSEKLKQMDDMHTINKKCADLEAKIKDLESKLAEKDAMIKVLQRHSMEKDLAYHNVIMRSPRHTPHASLQAQLSTPSSLVDPNPNGSLNEETNHVIPAVAAALSSLTIDSSNNNTTTNCTPSDNEDLKKLDSQVLSKDSIIHALRAEKEKYPSHFWRV